MSNFFKVCAIKLAYRIFYCRYGRVTSWLHLAQMPPTGSTLSTSHRWHFVIDRNRPLSHQTICST